MPNNACPICNNPTFLVYGKYPRKDGLCKECSQQLFNKEIEQCPDCKHWHKTTEICNCKKVKQERQTSSDNTKNIIVINEENKSRCITCGKKTNGLLFCNSCYHKYNNKELLFKITGCSSVEFRNHTNSYDYQNDYCKYNANDDSFFHYYFSLQ